jgi:hypothetical protein
MKKPTNVLAACALGAIALALSCSEDVDDAGGGASGASASNGPSSGGNGPGGGFNQGGNGTTAGTYSSGVGGPPTEIATCLGMVYQCGDLQDNDADGLIDSQDPDCLGPCDNTEDSYFGGIPGQAGDPCRVDCYFDFDSGQGNDECNWSHWCDPHEVAPNYYPEPESGALCAYDPNMPVPSQNGPPKSCQELYTMQVQQCLDYCGPLTPNGCDCFGCCELPAGSGQYIWLGSEGASGNTVCTQADINDPTKCHPCMPVQACMNPCDPCELCIGKPTVDPGCNQGTGGGSQGQCDPGLQPCGLPGQAPCPAGTYCITGCCQATPE